MTPRAAQRCGTVALFCAWVALLGASAQGQTLPNAKAGVPLIAVEGQATRELQPDMAVITVGITTDRPTATEAAAQNNETAAGLLDEIKANGVADRDVQTIQVNLAPVFDTSRTSTDTTRVKAFHASNIVEIRVRNLATVGDIVGRLIDKGANRLQRIDFAVSNSGSVLDDMRADATRNARHRAEIYADAAGVKLGRVLEILPETSTPVPYVSRIRAESTLADAPVPATPLQAGTQTLESRVKVTWELLQ